MADGNGRPVDRDRVRANRDFLGEVADLEANVPNDGARNVECDGFHRERTKARGAHLHAIDGRSQGGNLVDTLFVGTDRALDKGRGIADDDARVGHCAIGGIRDPAGQLSCR
jgi:hypothetical protein